MAHRLRRNPAFILTNSAYLSCFLRSRRIFLPDNINEAITGWTRNARRRLHDIFHVDPCPFRARNIVPGIYDCLAKLDFLERMFRCSLAVLGFAFVEVAHL
jgi:hypothetical protein